MYCNNCTLYLGHRPHPPTGMPEHLYVRHVITSIHIGVILPCENYTSHIDLQNFTWIRSHHVDLQREYGLSVWVIGKDPGLGVGISLPTKCAHVDHGEVVLCIAACHPDYCETSLVVVVLVTRVCWSSDLNACPVDCSYTTDNSNDPKTLR